MAVLDAVVLFEAADPSHRHHRDAVSHIARQGKTVPVAASLIESDPVLRARGYSPASQGMLAKSPGIGTATATVAPRTLYLAASIGSTGLFRLVDGRRSALPRRGPRCRSSPETNRHQERSDLSRKESSASRSDRQS